MNIELTRKQFRRLLDMVYIGNWVINSSRGKDRIPDFDNVESLLFSLCEREGMDELYQYDDGVCIPSRAFAEGGIHEAIMDYEDSVFFGILAEELASRDVYIDGNPQDSDALLARTRAYISEFEANGLSNISVDTEI